MTMLRDDVIAALGTVRDPELDEPLTDLGFVSACEVSAEGDVTVRVRLPTFFCAANFAFLMVADSYDAVSGVPGVRHTEVLLDDHFASEQINSGVAARAGFGDTFGALAAGELDELRQDFLRKAVLAGTDRACKPLAQGRTSEEIVALCLGDVPDAAERERLRERRSELGLPAGDDDPLLIDPVTGDRIEADAVSPHLSRARLTRTSLEANGGICRGMLRERYLTIGVGEKDD